MKPYEDNQKPKRKKDHKNKQKHYFDDDKFYQQKINKEFKYRKKYLSDDEDDWKDWDKNQ